MELKVGDKVRSPKYGKGKVVAVDGCAYAVGFKKPNLDLHNCGGLVPYNHGAWYTGGGLSPLHGDQLTLRQPKPAVPEGWTPASEPPNLPCDTVVRVRRASGIEEDQQFIITHDHKGIAFRRLDGSDWTPLGGNCYFGQSTIDPVIAWRELQPDKPARIAVGSKVIIRGVVTEDDGSPYRPYRIIPNGDTSGARRWFDADELELDNG